MKMEQIECSETSAYKIQTLGNYPKENIQYSEHGESLKSRTADIYKYIMVPCINDLQLILRLSYKNVDLWSFVFLSKQP